QRAGLVFPGYNDSKLPSNSSLERGLLSQANTISDDQIQNPELSPEETELEELERMLRVDPASMELHFRRAVLLAESGQFLEAREEYLKMLERDPDNLAVLNSLGNLLVSMKLPRAAQITYRQAVAKHPSDAVSRVNLGNLLLFEIEQLESRQRNEDAL